MNESPYSQEGIEEAMLGDDRVSEMLDVAEDELTDACVTGELSETDKAKFVSNFLTSAPSDQNAAIDRPIEEINPKT